MEKKGTCWDEGIDRRPCVGGVGNQRLHCPSKAELYSSFYLSIFFAFLCIDFQLPVHFVAVSRLFAVGFWPVQTREGGSTSISPCTFKRYLIASL